MEQNTYEIKKSATLNLCCSMRNFLLTMCLCLCGIVANAQEVNVDGVQYFLFENEAEVISGGDYRGDITIPATITYEGETYEVVQIRNIAFLNCTELTSITLPSSINAVGAWAFEGCTGLTAVTFPEGITTISNSVFYNCSSLTSVTFPESVTYIDSWVFEGCSSLETVTLPKEVYHFGKGVFWGCENLKEVTLPEGISEIGELTFYNCRSLTSITIPSGVTSIGNSAFNECSSLASVDIPSSVTSIGDGAFGYCSSLTSIVLPSSLTSIGSFAFCECTSLESIDIPKGVSKIEENTFYYCISLASAIIPEGIITIEEFAFHLCRSLETLILPESLTHIGERSFSCCSKLASITFPKSMKSFGEGVLESNTALTFVKLPEIDSIAKYTLNYCSNLETLVLPANLKSVEDSAFTHCQKLHDVYCYALQTPTVESNAGWDFGKVTLHVPAAAIENYRLTAPWSNSKQIVALTAEDEEKFTVKVSSVTINQAAAILVAGENLMLTATVDPANATDRKVIWNTSDATIAAIVDGKVIAKSAGTATITAKAGDKEAACVVKVNAGITAISELNNKVLYAVSQPNHSKGATSWAVDEDGQTLVSNHDLRIDVHGADTRQQFAFVSNDGGNAFYLYHVAEAKFVYKDGSLGDKPVDAILFKTGAYANTFVAYFDLLHNINVGGIRQMTIDNWNVPDGGNSCVITPVGEFDPTEVLKAFDADADDTGIDNSASIIHNSEAIYDLMGRRVEKAEKGIYIINGCKVVL